MKRIVKAICEEKEEQKKEKENESKDLETIKSTYNEGVDTHEPKKEIHNDNSNPCEKENLKPNTTRTSHPNHQKSPPSKTTKRGEGQGV